MATPTSDEHRWTLFVKSNELALVFDDDEARVTWGIPHNDRSPAPGDVKLTDDQVRQLYDVLRLYYRGSKR